MTAYQRHALALAVLLLVLVYLVWGNWPIVKIAAIPPKPTHLHIITD